uniref:Uncharacterized protein n=1 Tax=Oryza punctata TaxID=4537 RepID=A0A0E0LLS7_ORYPU
MAPHCRSIPRDATPPQTAAADRHRGRRRSLFIFTSNPHPRNDTVDQLQGSNSRITGYVPKGRVPPQIQRRRLECPRAVAQADSALVGRERGEEEGMSSVNTTLAALGSCGGGGKLDGCESPGKDGARCAWGERGGPVGGISDLVEGSPRIVVYHRPTLPEFTYRSRGGSAAVDWPYLLSPSDTVAS